MTSTEAEALVICVALIRGSRVRAVSQCGRELLFQFVDGSRASLYLRAV